MLGVKLAGHSSFYFILTFIFLKRFINTSKFFLVALVFAFSPSCQFSQFSYDGFCNLLVPAVDLGDKKLSIVLKSQIQ